MTPTADTATRSRPILFSGPMVRAILDGRKTQTRRVIREAPEDATRLRLTPYGVLESYIGDLAEPPLADGEAMAWAWVISDHGCETPVRCPYGQPGDTLWVRETWQDYCPLWGGTWCGHGTQEGIERDHRPVYAADPPELHLRDGRIQGHDYGDRPPTPAPPTTWRPSIHMPRWASRLTLEVVGVRVERVQDISEADAIAEGVRIMGDGSGVYVGREGPGRMVTPWPTAREAFADLWGSINAARGFGWDANPWVWAVEFKPALCDGGAA